MIRAAAEIKAALGALTNELTHASPIRCTTREHVAHWAFDFMQGWAWHSHEMTWQEALASRDLSASEAVQRDAMEAFHNGFTARERWIAGVT